MDEINMSIQEVKELLEIRDKNARKDKELFMKPSLNEFIACIKFSTGAIIYEYEDVTSFKELCTHQNLQDAEKIIMVTAHYDTGSRTEYWGRIEIAMIETGLVVLDINNINRRAREDLGNIGGITKTILKIYLNVQWLLQNGAELVEYKTVRKPQTINVANISGKKPVSRTRTYVYRKYVLSQESIENVKSEVANRQMNCEAWGVRGHYRHYKNGRAIFIKQHLKGKHKENYTGKEYVLFEKKGNYKRIATIVKEDTTYENSSRK